MVSEYMGEIHNRISAHFALEEAEMRLLDYAGYEEHKAAHEQLPDDLLAMIDAHERGEANDYDVLLSAHLVAWFGDRFRTRDSRLHRLYSDAIR